MTPRHSTGRKITSLLLFAGVLALFAAIAVAPFLRLTMLDDAMARDRDRLAELRRQISTLAGRRLENEELAALGQEKRLLLEGGTVGIAGANLQKLMNDVVLKHGGAASSFQILPPKEDGPVTRIAMSLSVSVRIDGLRNILYDVETALPLIFIDGVTIRAPRGEKAGVDPYFIGPFDVTLRVSGFVSKDRTS
jgi:general secretion pathway protein M